MKLKNIDFTNSARTTIVNYLDAKAEAKAATTKEKTLKAELEKVFSDYGKAMTDKSKSSFIGGFIQKSMERVGVVYRKTWTEGSIDWQTYALSLGGTPEEAENFRKPGHWTTACDYANEKQQKELEERA